VVRAFWARQRVTSDPAARPEAATHPFGPATASD